MVDGCQWWMPGDGGWLVMVDAWRWLEVVNTGGDDGLVLVVVRGDGVVESLSGRERAEVFEVCGGVGSYEISAHHPNRARTRLEGFLRRRWASAARISISALEDTMTDTEVKQTKSEKQKKNGPKSNNSTSQLHNLRDLATFCKIPQDPNPLTPNHIHPHPHSQTLFIVSTLIACRSTIVVVFMTDLLFELLLTGGSRPQTPPLLVLVFPFAAPRQEARKFVVLH